MRVRSVKLIALGRESKRQDIQPFNHSTIQPFNHQPFNHSTMQPCNHATMQPCNHATIQPCNHSTIQPFNHGWHHYTKEHWKSGVAHGAVIIVVVVVLLIVILTTKYSFKWCWTPTSPTSLKDIRHNTIGIFPLRRSRREGTAPRTFLSLREHTLPLLPRTFPTTALEGR